MRHLAGPLSRYGLLIGLLLLAAWVKAAAPDARGATAARNDIELALDFDIPAQPLATALDQYAALTHLSVLVASDRVHDRTSSTVRGHLTADAALRQLLAGTGLTAERQQGGTSYFVTQVATPPRAPDVGRAALQIQPAYINLLQASIVQALCADPRTVPGGYRLVFRVRLDPSGRLDAPHLYASTGDAKRDAAVLEALRKVHLGPPPAALAQQAIMMTLLPEDAQDMRCEPGTSSPAPGVS